MRVRAQGRRPNGSVAPMAFAHANWYPAGPLALVELVDPGLKLTDARHSTHTRFGVRATTMPTPVLSSLLMVMASGWPRAKADRWASPWTGAAAVGMHGLAEGQSRVYGTILWRIENGAGIA